MGIAVGIVVGVICLAGIAGIVFLYKQREYLHALLAVYEGQQRAVEPHVFLIEIFLKNPLILTVLNSKDILIKVIFFVLFIPGQSRSGDTSEQHRNENEDEAVSYFPI